MFCTGWAKKDDIKEEKESLQTRVQMLVIPVRFRVSSLISWTFRTAHDLMSGVSSSSPGLCNRFVYKQISPQRFKYLVPC